MRFRKEFTTDRILIGVFIIGSAWALVTAFQFPARDALFPQLASGLILIGSLLLLAINFLPDSVTDTINRNDDLFSTEEMDEVESDSRDLNSRKRYLLIGMICFYLLLGYLIGLLWATPVFVLAYSLSVKQNLAITVVLTLLSFGIAYGFMNILHLSLAHGVLLGGV